MGHSLSAVLMAAMLCPLWGYGGAKKQGGTLTGSPGFGQAVINEQAELAVLDAGARVPWLGDDRQQAQALFARLKERKIAIQPTFYKLLEQVTPAQRGRLVSRCQAFFDSVDTREIGNTSCLTAMVRHKKHVCSLLLYSDDVIRRVARTPALRSLSSLFHCRGFPRAEEDTQAFMEWPLWWQGEGTERTLDRELLRTFSSMLHGRGLPDQKAVDDYLDWPIWWRGEGRARTLDRQLLRVFSSMFSGRGLPKKESVDDYLQLDIWWQGEDEVRALDQSLLRVFSSMFNGRGLPSRESVEEYLQWELWWQGEGKHRVLDRELLRSFSSMFHCRGLPNKKVVDDYLKLNIWWQEDGALRTLDRELLRVFSSMFSSKGLPDQKAVEDYLKWDIWWQEQGHGRTLDRGLLRTFSLMFNHRGFPDKKAVEDYLKWEIWWQGQGHGRTLDRRLLRAFSSIFSGKGLPDKKVVEDFLQLDVWWQREGEACTLDRELLRAFSSMLYGRGRLDKKAAADYLSWELWWQGKGATRVLDRELLRTFSSMFCGRGLPDKKAVEDYLQRDVWWKGDGEARTLDRELLRVFSSMFSGRGLPGKKVIKDYLELDVWWQGNGEARILDRELLRAFSSMFNGKGLPDQQAVQEYLQWPVWWPRGVGACALDRELLRAFSSMFHGRGFPDKKAVEDYLKWEFWWQKDGGVRTLDRELLQAFASMFHSKGLPEKRPTHELLQWLAWDEQGDRQTIKVMARLYSGAYAGHRSLGLPDINKLRREEQKLTALFPPAPGECDGDKQDDTLSLIKIVALYLANDGGTRQLSWTDCEAWLREHPGTLSQESLLSRLLLTLYHHGGRGVKEAVPLISGQPAATRWLILDALASGKAVAAVQYAVQAIEPTDWEDYLFFTGELQPVPSSQQWTTIKGYLQALAPVLPDREYQRRFLTLIWPLLPNDRERFVQPEAVSMLATLLPRLQVLRDLLTFLTSAELKTVFDTYLAYRAGQPDKQGLPTLFTALLVAPLPLLSNCGSDCRVSPEDLLARSHDHPGGAVIGVNSAGVVEDSVTLFLQVTAVLMERLWQSEYAINGPILTLWPHGETVPITFPTPSLVWHPDGVQIRHWTSAHLSRFLGVTRTLSDSEAHIE